MRRLFLFILFLLPVLAQAQVRVTTWNIEHLGSSGRGFGGGFGGGSLPLRTEDQLHAIGDFISDTLEADVIAVQEIAKTGPNDTSLELDIIVEQMGPSWDYYLAEEPDDSEMVNGFIWNSDIVSVIQPLTMEMPNIELAGKELFDRMPVVLYFETREEGQINRNDIVLVNVHLASGQTNDENHAIAMIAIEHGLNRFLDENEITESDRVILGDFNDNPHRLTDAGNPMYISTLYDHMERKGYTNIVPASVGFTRMDNNLRSLIDHILVNRSAANDIISEEADKYLPGDSDTFGIWRSTFSDHFPLSFELEIKADTDADFQD